MDSDHEQLGGDPVGVPVAARPTSDPAGFPGDPVAARVAADPVVVGEPAVQAIEEVAAATADRWVAAWTRGRTGILFRLLAANAGIESNLDPEGDFIEILTDYAATVDSIAVCSQTVLGGRVALVYDCTLRGELFRLAEFLVVDRVGLVREVRRIYDLSAVERLMPDLLIID